MKWNPEKASDFVRGFWLFMCVLCTFGSLAYIGLTGNAERAFVLALSGLGFFFMSHYRHDDLDV